MRADRDMGRAMRCPAGSDPALTAVAAALMLLAGAVPPRGLQAAEAGAPSPAVEAPAALKPGVDMAWTHTVTEVEDLARAALPLRFDVGGQWSGQKLVVEDVSELRMEAGKARLKIKGRIEPLGIPIDAEPILTLRFEPLKGEHLVGLQSLTLTLGVLGKVDLSRLLGPWVIKPDQVFVVPVRGGDGIGMQVSIRRLDISAAGLRAEADVRYFPPPTPRP